MALHDSFNNWDVCHMEFSATKKHIMVVYFHRVIEASYICVCNLESGTLEWKQLLEKKGSLATCSLWGEELIIMGSRDMWKVNVETKTSSSWHKLYICDSYQVATCYARFTDSTIDGSSSSAPRHCHFWRRLAGSGKKPPQYMVWNPETVTCEETVVVAQIEHTAAYLEVHDKNVFGYWVLDHLGQQICCIPKSEEHCSGWSKKTLNSVGRNRFALMSKDTDAIIVINYSKLME